MTSTHVLLVEDHAVLAFTLGEAMRAQGIIVTAPPLDSEKVVLETARGLAPDVVLLDLDLGGAIGDGRSLLPALSELDSRVVVFTGVMDWIRIGECLELGATDFVIKSEPFTTLLAAIEEAAAGGTRLRPSQRERLLDQLARHRAEERNRLAVLDRLTTCERRVLTGLMQGSKAETIAAECGVAEATVRSQIRGVLMKLGVASQLAAVAVARQAGWDENAALAQAQ
jgi:DNA-binding NarL/FixJ family response regulator